MIEIKCIKGVTIENIGSIQCSTCNSMIKDGYCTELKSMRIEKEKKIKKDKIEYCEDCIYHTTKNIPNRLKKMGYVARCVNRDIYLILNNKVCDRGKQRNV